MNWACATAGSARSISNANILTAQAVLKRLALVFGQPVAARRLMVFIGFQPFSFLCYMLAGWFLPRSFWPHGLRRSKNVKRRNPRPPLLTSPCCWYD